MNITTLNPKRLWQSPYLPKVSNLLMSAIFILVVTSLLMIASASIPFTQLHHLPELRFFWYQAAYAVVGVIMGWVVYQIPLKWYFNFPLIIISFCLICLLLVLTLASDPINNARRWLDLGVVNLQTAEFVKLLMVIITADYVVRRSDEVRRSLWSGWRLLIWYAPVAILFYFQPDFGSLVVIMATGFVILFISGTPLMHYAPLALVAVLLGAIFAWSARYRQGRIISFLDPFGDVENTGHQLSRALVAFARGDITGVGYGDSVLKLSHLSEAHTDFILAITGEELGFLGVAFVLMLLCIIVFCIMRVSYVCFKRRQFRLSYMVFGFGTIMFGQIFINVGMALGMAPTKGLTLPFYSFGGSSMLMFMMMIGIVLKVAKKSDEIYAQNKHREY